MLELNLVSNTKDCERLLARYSVITEPEFAQHVFACCTNEYVANGRTVKLYGLFALGFSARYLAVPQGEGKHVSPGSECHTKYLKYMRDVITDRGVINCLARETPCDCMKHRKLQAKSMEKVTVCQACNRVLPKEQALVCSGCGVASYCNRECQLGHWPSHKNICRQFTKSVETPLKEQGAQLAKRMIRKQQLV